MFPRRRARPTGRLAMVAVALFVVTAGLAACGGSSSSTSTNAAAAGPGQGRRGFQISPQVTACLKKQGVTVAPFGRRRQGGPPSGGTRTAPPPNQRPRRRLNSAQAKKFRAAAQKCGLNFPGPGAGGPGGPGGPPPGTPGTSTTQQ